MSLSSLPRAVGHYAERVGLRLRASSLLIAESSLASARSARIYTSLPLIQRRATSLTAPRRRSGGW